MDAHSSRTLRWIILVLVVSLALAGASFAQEMGAPLAASPPDGVGALIGVRLAADAAPLLVDLGIEPVSSGAEGLLVEVTEAQLADLRAAAGELDVLGNVVGAQGGPELMGSCYGYNPYDATASLDWQSSIIDLSNCSAYVGAVVTYLHYEATFSTNQTPTQSCPCYSQLDVKLRNNQRSKYLVDSPSEAYNDCCPIGMMSLDDVNLVNIDCDISGYEFSDFDGDPVRQPWQLEFKKVCRYGNIYVLTNWEIRVYYSDPTATPTGTSTRTATPTPTPTRTNTPTHTATRTLTFTPTSTRTRTPTYTATYTPGPTNTRTPTRTFTTEATATRTSTGTPTATPEATYTPSDTPTVTETPGETRTPTETPVEFPTATPTTLPVAAISVHKYLVDPPSGTTVLGDMVSFVINVGNTGDTSIAHIELHDTYDTDCFEFVSAQPSPSSVDAATGRLVWDDVAQEWALEPGDWGSVHVDLRAISGEGCKLAMNCAEVVDAVDELGQHLDSKKACDVVEIVPESPQIEISKVALDPVICAGDPAIYEIVVTNTGTVPWTTLAIEDTYDWRYLGSQNDPAEWGDEEGHLEREGTLAPFGGRPGQSHRLRLEFNTWQEVASTLNEIRATVDGDPTIRAVDTADLAIWAEAGLCEGNLILNGGFEEGVDPWQDEHALPVQRTTMTDFVHSGDYAVQLGNPPWEYDLRCAQYVVQEVTIPADAHSAFLSFWYAVWTDDPDVAGNHFWAKIQQKRLRMGDVIWAVPAINHTSGWQQVTVDLTPYIGDTVSICFWTQNDGGDTGRICAWVDDVRLCLSRCGSSQDRPFYGGGGGIWGDGGGSADHNPSGMPDVSQAQPSFDGRMADGPVAAANALWWLDSEGEPGDTPPPTVSDGHALVEAYGAWDDHDPRNVVPLVEDLATRLHTDGVGVPETYVGTRPEEMADGLRDYIDAQGLAGDYGVTLLETPSFDTVADLYGRGDAVLLLVGLWEYQPEGWRRLGGHWVTVADVDRGDARRLAISDPLVDAGERGWPGIVGYGTDGLSPVEKHNDVGYASHDIFYVAEHGEIRGGGAWSLADYPRWDEIGGRYYPELEDLFGANTPPEHEGIRADRYQLGPIESSVEFAISASPFGDDVALRLSPSDVTLHTGRIAYLSVVAESRTQAYDTVQIHLNFDPEALRIREPGLSPARQILERGPSVVLQNVFDNEAGTLDYVAMVPLGQGAVTGQYPIAEGWFEPVAPTENTAVEFAWDEDRRTDVMRAGESVLGDVEKMTVHIEEAAIVEGSVRYQGRPEPPHARWETHLYASCRATDDGPRSVDALTTDTGGFTIDGISPGEYTILAKGMHSLMNRRENVTLVAGVNAIDMGELLEGDADNNNRIDAADASLVNLAFGSEPGDANWDARADFNEDGMVSGADMSLMAPNYGLVGPILLGDEALAGAPARSGEPASFGPTQRWLGMAGAVDLGFEPSASTMSVGDTVTVDVMLHTGAQEVDTVDLAIHYPTANLAAVDATGDPATETELAAAFDQPFINEVDAEDGVIRLAAAVVGDSVSGDVSVATLRFKALVPSSAGARLTYSMWDPASDALRYGESVLGDWTSCVVTITGGHDLCLPLTLKR